MNNKLRQAIAKNAPVNPGYDPMLDLGIDTRSERTWIEDKPFREPNAKLRGAQATKGVNRCPMGDVPNKRESQFEKKTIASVQALRPMRKRVVKC